MLFNDPTGITAKTYPNLPGFFSRVASVSLNSGIVAAVAEYTGDKTLDKGKLQALLTAGAAPPKIKVDDVGSFAVQMFSLKNAYAVLDPFDGDQIVLDNTVADCYQNGKFHEPLGTLFGTLKIYDITACVLWGVVQWRKQAGFSVNKMNSFWKKLDKAAGA